MSSPEKKTFQKRMEEILESHGILTMPGRFQEGMDRFLEAHGIQTIDRTSYDTESATTIVKRGFRARKGERTEAQSNVPRKLRYKGNDSKRFL